MLIQLKNISKIYKNGNIENKVLDNISLNFPCTGLVSIVGKSGSGKSTILNMISRIDNPTSGDVLFKGKSILKWNNKKVNEFRNNFLGFVFQNNNLLENENVVTNISLPMLINGCKINRAEEDAKILLEKIDFPKKLYGQKVNNLSGGEKQRVTLLRALINDPFLILADEPTGALDSDNAIKVMEMLKNISKKRLVILVSHNTEMVEKYSDQIIKLKDGKVENILTLNSTSNDEIFKEKRVRKSKKWIDKLSLSNFIKKRKRNLLSILALIVGITSSILIGGFCIGSKSSINKELFKHLDYGTATISKEIKIEKVSSGISLVKTLRPSLEEIENLKNELANCFVQNNYDALISKDVRITYEKGEIKDLSLSPVYLFSEPFIDFSLIKKGTIPNGVLNECLINEQAYKTLSKTFDPIGKTINVKTSYEYNCVFENQTLIEHFEFSIGFLITGVVSETNFLATPKLYYSYSAFDEFVAKYPMINLSKETGETITWKDYISNAKNDDEISSYSYRVFLKNCKDRFNLLSNEIVLNSNAETIHEGLNGLIDACTYGMVLFLFIAILGSILTLGIVVFASYKEDSKQIAILKTLGASKDNVSTIYCNESLLIGMFATLISFVLSYVLAYIINVIISNSTGFESLIKIPWKSYLNIPLLFPIGIFIIIVVLCCLCSWFPIAFSKGVSVKEELAEE